MSIVDVVFSMLGVLAACYWFFALACVIRLARRPAAPSRRWPPVTILKPLCGDDGRLDANLRTFCTQDYPVYEVILGVRDATDPAVAVAARLTREFHVPRVRLVVDGRTTGANRKVANLLNMVRHARHQTLVIADADMAVTPDYLRAVVGPLDDSAIGLTTCLYVAIPDAGLASRLGAMFINDWFLPAACAGAALEPLRHAFGATLACRRSTLVAVGGLEALADDLADDHRLGALVSARGWRVALVPYLVCDHVVEPSLRALFLHELRWARTLRTLRPVGYALSLLTHAIPVSLVWLACASNVALALGMLGAHVGLRVLARAVIHRAVAQPLHWGDTLLVPARDVVSFVVGLLAFTGRQVRWNDDCLRVDAGGRLRPVATTDPLPEVRKKTA